MNRFSQHLLLKCQDLLFYFLHLENCEEQFFLGHFVDSKIH